MVDPMSVNYNLTEFSNISIIDTPADAIGWFNNALGGNMLFILVGVIGLVLFLVSRKFVDSDTEALSYAGFVMSIVSFFLFLIRNSAGERIFGWGYFVIVLVFTAICLYLNMVNRRY